VSLEGYPSRLEDPEEHRVRLINKYQSVYLPKTQGKGSCMFDRHNMQQCYTDQIIRRHMHSDVVQHQRRWSLEKQPPKSHIEFTVTTLGIHQADIKGISFSNTMARPTRSFRSPKRSGHPAIKCARQTKILHDAKFLPS
jgi:hypothetical protein